MEIYPKDQINLISQNQFYPRIYDIPQSDIILLLDNNRIEYSIKDDIYMLADELIFSNKLGKAPDSIVNWIVAHNIDKNNVGYYSINDIFDMELRDIKNQLGVDNINYSDIVQILDYIRHLRDDNIIYDGDRYLSITKNGEELYVCGKGTFALKDDIKFLVGNFDFASKCWKLPKYKVKELLDLIYIPNIPYIKELPRKIPNELQIYNLNYNIMVCGKKTYEIKDDLKYYNAKFNPTNKCWIIPRQNIDDVKKIVDNLNNKLGLEKEETIRQRNITRQLNTEEKERKLKEKYELEKRLSIPEKEDNFIPHIRRLPPAVIELAIKNDTFEDLYDDMEQKDVEELERLWDNKIVVVGHKSEFRGSTSIVTYIGDIKPPDIAFEYWKNSWHSIPAGHPGFSVRKIDHKLYEVHAFTTD